MHIKTKIYHFVSPQDGSTKGQKSRKAVKTVQLWLQEVTPEDLVPAFIVDDQTFYWYQDKLWCKVEHDSSEETALEAFLAGCEKGKLTKPVQASDTFSAMYERASALISKRLACNGEIYVVTGEPHYCLRYNQIWTQSNGRLIAFVSTSEEDFQRALTFNALQEDLLHKYIRIVKAVMQYNISVTIHGNIQVLLPEAVKYPPAEDLTKVEKKERIICDCYLKGVNVPFPGNATANREFAAVNKMYSWLYREGILMQQSFVARDYKHVCHFGIDARELAKFRTAMLASGIEDAALAVEILLDRDVTPCIYTGAITLSSSMSTFRGTNDVVSKSWECYMVHTFGVENAERFLEISQREGTRASIEAMYKTIQWKPDYIAAKGAGIPKKS